MKKQLKKGLSWFLTVVLLLGLLGAFPAVADPSAVWDGSIASEFSGGDGTEANPYKIATGAQLALLAKYVNEANASYNGKYYQLTADINLNDVSAYENWTASTTGLNPWTPIGYTNTFSGHLNGNGYAISGLYMTGNAVGTYSGLFGHVSGGEVKDLRVTHAFIDLYLTADVLSTNAFTCGGVGAVAGRISSGAVLDGCASNAKITVTKVKDSANSMHVGGVVGEAGARSTGAAAESSFQIVRCAFEGEVTGVNCTNDNSTVGGICGNAASIGRTSSIEQCVNHGSVNADTPKAAGGILGMSHGMWTVDSRVDIRNCCNTGRIKVNASMSGTGGIVGFAYASATVENCFNVGAVSDGTRPRQMVSDYYAASYGFTWSFINDYINADDETMGGTMECNNAMISLSLGANEFVAENLGTLPEDV